MVWPPFPRDRILLCTLPLIESYGVTPHMGSNPMAWLHSLGSYTTVCHPSGIKSFIVSPHGIESPHPNPPKHYLVFCFYVNNVNIKQMIFITS